MRLSTEPLDLPLASPFRIARSVQTHGRNVLLRLRADEHGDEYEGWGEAAPTAYYGESRETVEAALARFADVLSDDPFQHEDIMAEVGRLLGKNGAAKAALDMALYDLAGKRLGAPLYRLLGLNPARAPATSFTLGIDAPAEMARKAAAARDYPILKIKVGTPHDVEIVKAIREVTGATLRVDANAAWTAKQAIATINALAPYDIEFVEQPVAAGDLDGLRLVREHVSIPVIADESCVTLDDIARVAGRADGINIKLMKCGGVSHALKMIHAARAHNLSIMLGCMAAESSIAITAAAHLTPLVDYADLDGPLLLASDPYVGVRYEHGKLLLPDGPGLGVHSRQARSGADAPPIGK